ncbi:MAG: hypothetical protein ACJ8CR_23655 [Roseiflexaceae bacterium]
MAIGAFWTPAAVLPNTLFRSISVKWRKDGQDLIGQIITSANRLVRSFRAAPRWGSIGSQPTQALRAQRGNDTRRSL